MSRQSATSAQRVIHQDAGIQVDRRLQNHESVGRHQSELNDAVAANIANGYDRGDGSSDGISNRATTHRYGHWYNTDREPRSPPPPYSEHDHHLGVGERPSSNRFDFYPGEGGRPDYVTDSSGRRERYVIDERGERVPWPFPDHENSSDDGDGDPDMVHLESGRIIPRGEWEADHPWEPSSDEPSDDTDEEVTQSHCYPMSRTRTPPYWTSEHEESGHDVSRVRSGHSAGSRHRRRQSLAGRGERSRHRV